MTMPRESGSASANSKARDLLLRAVLEDREVLLRQPLHEAPLGVVDRDVELDEVHLDLRHEARLPLQELDVRELLSLLVHRRRADQRRLLELRDGHETV